MQESGGAMTTRTTLTVAEELHEKVTSLLKDANQRFNALVNDLLQEWVKAQERQRFREQLRKRFQSAFSIGGNVATEQAFESEWAEVDEESANLLDNVP